MTIRRAAPADAESAAGLYLRARRAAARSGSIPPSHHPDREVGDWITHVVFPNHDVWLAEDAEGATVGMLVLEHDWVDQLYVDPDLTGRGIGRKLLDVAKLERPNGLRLWTFVSNTRAQRFYERHGFTETERTDGSLNEEQSPDIQYVWHGD